MFIEWQWHEVMVQLCRFWATPLDIILVTGVETPLPGLTVGRGSSRRSIR